MNKLKRISAILLAVALCGCSATEETNQSNSFADLIGGTTAATEQSNPDTSTGGSANPSHSATTTGALSANATEYEGEVGTGDFNYGEALQKSILFYELQRSGDLPDETRCNWRGDSGMTDGADAGVDLTGGLYDAGDNAKFNLPMAYTGAMLAWSVYEDFDSYEKSGQLQYQLDNIRWINDYLIKCHTAEFEFYYQVGDGNLDHAWWGPSEVMTMDRPCFKVTMDSPGSCVVAEAAASLAACAAVFKDIDPEYAGLCLTHAKELYNFAEITQSDAGYTAANGFYNSHSGFNDELTWAASWLYTITNNEIYKANASKYFDVSSQDTEWTMCWDCVTLGAAVRLADLTGEQKYKDFIDANLSFWLNDIQYTPDGLAWLDTWGSLRYSTTTAFIAAVYSESESCSPENATKYWDFAVSQINYALGSSGRSFVCGFGENYPVNPHHRTAQGSYCDNKNEPSTARHTLFGALVGGPDATGSYEDNVDDYNKNEVACDYNAGFTGALAKLYSRYGGQTLVNFGAVEEPTCEEFYADACVNVAGADFTEIKAIVYNVSAWPARSADNLELRYYMDLSEVESPENLTVTMNYSQGGNVGKIMTWDADKNLYYASVDFSGDKICPGSQNSYKREVQFRISANDGTWDVTNDPSYTCISGAQGSLVRALTFGLYEDGKLVYGTEPDGSGIITPIAPSENSPVESNDNQTQSPAPSASTASNGDISLKYTATDAQSSQNLTLNLEITNESKNAIALSELEVKYFFTADGSSALSFACDHTAIQNGDNYVALSGLSGAFSAVSGNNSDTCVTIKCSDNASIEPNGTWKIQARINKSDWSNFNTSNDFSALSAENTAVYSGGKLIFGNEP